MAATAVPQGEKCCDGTYAVSGLRQREDFERQGDDSCAAGSSALGGGRALAHNWLAGRKYSGGGRELRTEAESERWDVIRQLDLPDGMNAVALCGMYEDLRVNVALHVLFGAMHPLVYSLVEAAD